MITVIDYGAGNLRSVCLALTKIGAQWQVSDKPDEILAAERVIFPGVGAAASAVATLKKRGLEDAIRQYVASGKPFLGICLGTQIIFDHSEEDGGTDCLGLIKGDVKHFEFPANVRASVPHMGWNQVKTIKSHPLFKDIAQDANFYFVHSYFPTPADDSLILAQTDYSGVEFTCAIARKNLAATQFHPEKSGKHGLQLLKNFMTWEGSENA
jgi:glutamine amidotransferase